MLAEDVYEFISSIDIMVIVNKDNEINKIFNYDLSKLDIIDLVRVTDNFVELHNYEGICW